MSEFSRLLTAPQCAERLGISPKTLRNLYRCGQLPSIRIGGSVRIAESDLEDFLQRNRQAAPA